MERGLKLIDVSDKVIDTMRQGIAETIDLQSRFFGINLPGIGLMYPWDGGLESDQIVRDNQGNATLVLARLNIERSRIDYSPLYLQLRADYLMGRRYGNCLRFGKYTEQEVTSHEIHHLWRYKVKRKESLEAARLVEERGQMNGTNVEDEAIDFATMDKEIRIATMVPYEKRPSGRITTIVNFSKDLLGII